MDAGLHCDLDAHTDRNGDAAADVDSDGNAPAYGHRDGYVDADRNTDPDGDGDFADRVDVINLSLGSPYGELYDPTTIAADNAAQLGVIVVASAGNSGDDFFVVGSPSNADRSISVAAIQHGQVTLADGEMQRVEYAAGFSSRGPRAGDAGLKPDLAAPGVGIVSASSLSGTGARTLSG
ncbi:MAG: S8 family serine peptidase, partial [Caldilinea sp.]|nr:S8 family serine peptidase [Caldilinea sp.]